MPVSTHPTQLERLDEHRLLIHWSDGRKREYTLTQLRTACPAASCREKRSAPPAPPTLLPVLSAAEAKPLSIVSMSPVGYYAYSIEFSDGHNTGIYTLELLHGLGKETP